MKNVFVLVLAFSLLLFGCTSVQVEDDLALAVWQHGDGSASDVWYSIYKHSEKLWTALNGSATAPVAVLSGVDRDPDVSSSGAYAVSVWEHENQIYSSVFDARESLVASWSQPISVRGQSGKNRDPTVVVLGAGGAFSAWVTDKEGGHLEFSFFDGKIWNGPTKVKSSEFGTLPEAAAFGKGILLAWVSPQGVMAGILAGGSWADLQLVSSDAKTDYNNPSDLRIGVSAKKNEAMIVWTSKSGSVLYSKFSEGKWSAPKAYSKEQSPDVANGRLGFYSVFEESQDLSGTDFSSVEKVSTLSQADLRPAITFIKSGSTAVSVWWNPIDPSGEIYYSTKDEGAPWQAPARVNGVVLEGLDRNPAITPLTQLDILDEPFCPNGVLDAGEQCEMGIACANPNDFCNVWTCTCSSEKTPTPTPSITPVITYRPPTATPSVTPTDQTPTPTPIGSPTPSRVVTPRCGDGYVSTPNVPGGGNEDCDIGGRYVPLNASAERVQCGPGKLCINCKCVSMSSVPCSGNTRELEITKSQRFISRGMSCLDDCSAIYGVGYTCNLNSCTCSNPLIQTTPSPTPTPAIIITGTTATPVATVTEIIITAQPTITETTTTPAPTATPTATPTPCPDSDQDGKCNSQDNCQNTPNPEQEDSDQDGIGDYCDPTPENCQSYCSGQGGYAMVSESSTLTTTNMLTGQSCADSISAQDQSCTTICIFSKFQAWTYTVGDTMVNQYGCCCKKIFWLPCSNCPAQSPSTPICPTQSDCSAQESQQTNHG